MQQADCNTDINTTAFSFFSLRLFKTQSQGRQREFSGLTPQLIENSITSAYITSALYIWTTASSLMSAPSHNYVVLITQKLYIVIVVFYICWIKKHVLQPYTKQHSCITKKGFH